MVLGKIGDVVQEGCRGEDVGVAAFVVRDFQRIREHALGVREIVRGIGCRGFLGDFDGWIP